MAKSEWRGKFKLLGEAVEQISSELTSGNYWTPVKLDENSGFVFKGTEPNGEGFLLDHLQAKELVSQDPKLSEVMFPYLIARDLNQTSDQIARRWIICFWDWGLKKAKRYPAALSILRIRVKPVRQRVDEETGDYLLGTKLAENWWLLKRARPDLYRKIGRGSSFTSQTDEPQNVEQMDKVIVFARGATKYPSFSYVSNDQIFGDALCVIATNSMSLFTVLSSDIHSVWAWEYGGRKTHDLSYNQATIFETFPFPAGAYLDKCEPLIVLGT